MKNIDPRFVSFHLSSAPGPKQNGKMLFQVEIHLKNESPLGNEQIGLSMIVETEDQYPVDIGTGSGFLISQAAPSGLLTDRVLKQGQR